MADAKEILKNPRFILKIVQLIFAIVCIALIQDPIFNGTDLFDVHRRAVVLMVYCGYVLIPLMDISRIVAGEKTGTSLAMIWSFVGAVLWIAAGALVIEHYRALDGLLSSVAGPYLLFRSSLDKLIASGILGLLNALVYFTETAITFKFG